MFRQFLTYSGNTGNTGSKCGRQMPRKPSFKFTKTTSGWKVEIPERLSPTGKRQRIFFPTRDEAKNFASELRSDYEAHGTKASVISPSLADEATRASSLLEPFGISLSEAAQRVMEVKNAELYRSQIEMSHRSGLTSVVWAFRSADEENLRKFEQHNLSDIWPVVESERETESVHLPESCKEECAQPGVRLKI
ncbi:hypothetical protein HW115_02810 [Verrucomicrobiaceae bacterium N1E253]|uniref:Uncharacterized protein n=1 Tax=Oceaniferula marina TaxID=2748318 RepID=A0A851GGZ6_9BACT|nr:hypothetical protein [Oceaniferula marina]NWK54525.1 hypothetical protein [Oceaniferula marina]